MIYTKTGDNGTTSLIGGSRVMKNDVRVEAYGTVDELNSHIGLAAEMFKSLGGGYTDELKDVQNNLFTIQTILATESDEWLAKLPQLDEAEVEMLERQIDAINDSLPKLNSFVVAGGSVVGAQCHVARCVCRRAERCVVTLSQNATVNPTVLSYLNRLSDYLFVLSRKAVLAAGGDEVFYTVNQCDKK